jgi:non-specific serine/threonine protein kinase
MELLAADDADLRAALAVAEADGSGLQLVTALGPWWLRRGRWQEGRQWLERAIAAASDVDEGDLAAARLELGLIALEQADDEGAAAALSAALPALQARGSGVLPVLHGLGRLAARRGDHDEARRHLLAGMSSAREAGDRGASASFGLVLAHLAQADGDLGGASELLHAATADARAAGRLQHEAAAQNMWGVVTYQQGRLDEAEQHLATAAAAFRSIGVVGDLAATLANLGAVVAARRGRAAAEPIFMEALTVCDDLGDDGLTVLVRTEMEEAFAAAAP